MYKLMAVCFVAFSLVSCRSADKVPLTQSECDVLAQKEAAHLASRFNKFPEMKGALLRLADSRAAQCAAGNGFDREDYKCMMAANSAAKMDDCLKAGSVKAH